MLIVAKLSAESTLKARPGGSPSLDGPYRVDRRLGVEAAPVRPSRWWPWLGRVLLWHDGRDVRDEQPAPILLLEHVSFEDDSASVLTRLQLTIGPALFRAGNGSHWVWFDAGRIVEAKAARGEDVLKKVLDSEEGARRLDEVALVPNSLPISKSGLCSSIRCSMRTPPATSRLDNAM